jgi:NTE family protein
MQELLARDGSQQRPRLGVGLAMSGGGYRAMLFHAGALRRLNELGYLPRLDFVSSVSGGSVTAGVLALAWKELDFGTGSSATNFDEKVLDPLLAMASRDIDVPSVLTGLLPWQRISDRVEAAYRKHLYGDASLQDLPDRPRFIFCATNLQTAALFRFSKKYAADWRLGRVPAPELPLATAVTASAAFPPFLSPVVLELPEQAWDPDPQYRPRVDASLREKIVLSDGGVYDNLGLEPIIKRCEKILVSDGGGHVGHPRSVPSDWVRHLLRVTSVIDHQVRSLRKRVLFEGYERGDYTGTYWGIRTEISKYALPDALPFPAARALELADIPTRLSKMSRDTDDLVGWGYAVCDAAVRRYDGTSAPVE